MASISRGTLLWRDLSVEEKFEQLMQNNPLGAQVCRMLPLPRQRSPLTIPGITRLGSRRYRHLLWHNRRPFHRLFNSTTI